MQAVIELRAVERIYRTDDIETLALAGIDLAIRDGDFVVVQGRSGCGKSTLLNVMGLIDAPDSGELLIDGMPVARLSESERAALRAEKIGFVFQFFHLIDDLTVEENIALPMLYARKSSREAATRVSALAERLGIAHRLKHFPRQLSGGQQPRVAIARALANEPRLLLVDEPTGNLDSEAGAQVLAELDSLNRAGHTIVMVTHEPLHPNPRQTFIRMRDGRIVDAG